MKAPEKIYVNIRQKPFEITFSEVVEKNVSNIEYTRTDAFFDKAAIWFDNNFIAYDECGSIGVISYSFDTEEEMLKDFIEYMKGE